MQIYPRILIKSMGFRYFSILHDIQNNIIFWDQYVLSTARTVIPTKNRADNKFQNRK